VCAGGFLFGCNNSAWRSCGSVEVTLGGGGLSGVRPEPHEPKLALFFVGRFITTLINAAISADIAIISNVSMLSIQRHDDL
jgi:hypothetical protein